MLVDHTAYRVTVALAGVGRFAAAAYGVPPHAEPTAGCVVHHPANEYPVGGVNPFARAASTEPAYVCDAVEPVPVFASYTYWLPDHCAYSVKFAVFAGEYDSPPPPTRLPPEAAVYHPLNANPERVGTAGSESDVPVTQDDEDAALPPCESYVTVLVFPVHCAYSVKLDVRPCEFGNVTAQQPLAAVNHPANE